MRMAHRGLVILVVIAPLADAVADVLVDYYIRDRSTGVALPVDTVNGKQMYILTVNKPYDVVIRIDSTGEPAKEIGAVDVDFSMYRGPNWPNYITFDGAAIDHGPSDFFFGHSTSWEHVGGSTGGVPDSDGYIRYNDRIIDNVSSGPSNRIGDLFRFSFTPIALMSPSTATSRFGFAPRIPFVYEKTADPVAVQFDRKYIAVVADLPEISVEQPSGTDLVDGAAVVDFGTALAESPPSRTFTIRNGGGAELTGLGITIDGPDAGCFSVTVNATAPVSGPGGSTTFTMSFTPTGPGAKTADLHIESNDGDENPFDISLTGTGLTALENWRFTHFGVTTSTGDASDTADPEGDGAENLLEFAFGLQPKEADAHLLPQIMLLDNTLTASFTQPAGVQGVTYDAESSENLSTWSTSGVEHAVSGDVHTFTVSTTGYGRLFLRLRVTNP